MKFGSSRGDLSYYSSLWLLNRYTVHLGINISLEMSDGLGGRAGRFLREGMAGKRALRNTALGILLEHDPLTFLLLVFLSPL